MTVVSVLSRRLHLARLAMADLLRRRTSTCLNVAQVAVAASYLLVLGSYSMALYRRQEETLARSVPTRIVASVHASDRGRRFTELRCVQLREQLQDTELLYPHVEIPQVRVRLAGRSAPDQIEALPAEGLIAADPLLQIQPFVIGRPFVDGNPRQAILGRALFERLGGAVSAVAVDPEQILISVERTRAGVPQAQEIALDIAGLLEHPPAAERIYLPLLELASELDLWTTGRIADFLGQRSGPAAWPGAVAYADPAHEARVAEEAKAHGAELVREAVLESALAQPLDGLIERTDGHRIAEAERKRIIVACNTLALAEVNQDWTGEFGVRVRVVTATQLRGLTRYGTAGAYDLRWLEPPRVDRLVRYRVRDPRRADGMVGSDLIQALGLSRPTFVGARPRLTVAARIGSTDLDVLASDTKDPERFAQPLLAGNWLSGGNREVVVPEAAASSIGSRVAIRVQRSGPGGRAEQLTLPLTVVGIRTGAEAFVPQDLAQELFRWQRAELQFDELRGEFESPVEASLRFGHVRCNVYARSIDAVPQVARQLQALGYRTEDQLAEQQGLRELGSALLFGLVLFAGGLLLSAAASVLLSAWLYVKNRMHEIGIIRAHGVRTREVAGMFAVQGLTLGGLSFVCAVGLVALGQPWFHRAVARVLGGGGVQASVFTGDGWWLLLLSLVVCLVFSLAGVILPAAYACRLAPVVALRRKE